MRLIGTEADWTHLHTAEHRKAQVNQRRNVTYLRDVSGIFGIVCRSD